MIKWYHVVWNDGDESESRGQVAAISFFWTHNTEVDQADCVSLLRKNGTRCCDRVGQSVLVISISRSQSSSLPLFVLLLWSHGFGCGWITCVDRVGKEKDGWISQPQSNKVRRVVMVRGLTKSASHEAPTDSDEWWANRSRARRGQDPPQLHMNCMSSFERQSRTGLYHQLLPDGESLAGSSSLRLDSFTARSTSGDPGVEDP